jgi:hypothetical protein
VLKHCFVQAAGAHLFARYTANQVCWRLLPCGGWCGSITHHPIGIAIGRKPRDSRHPGFIRGDQMRLFYEVFMGGCGGDSHEGKNQGQTEDSGHGQSGKTGKRNHLCKRLHLHFSTSKGTGEVVLSTRGRGVSDGKSKIFLTY